MNTTALLRWVHGETGGNIVHSMNILRNFSVRRITNAPNAYRVLAQLLKRSPDATHFSFNANAHITVTKEAA